MALSSENYKNIYVGNNVSTEFPYTFKIQAAADLEVIRYTIATGAQEILTIDTDYTIKSETIEEDPEGEHDGINDDAGGTVVLTEALLDIYDLIIRRKVLYLQETDWEQNGDFSTAVLEANLDRIYMVLLQLKEQMDRAIVQDPTLSAQVTFPIPESGKGIGWNTAGTALENKVAIDADVAAAAAASAATATTQAGLATTAKNAAEDAQDAAEAAAARVPDPADGTAGHVLAVNSGKTAFEMVARDAYYAD